MPQLVLPIFPVGSSSITAELTFERRDGRVTYFHGLMPVFAHDEGDIRTFRMITAQFCVQGSARECDIVRAFGVPAISVKRAVKRYRTGGPAAFYVPRRTRGPAVLTPEVVAAAQAKLDLGQEPSAVAAALDLKPDTLRKAIAAGRLHRSVKKGDPVRTRNVRRPGRRASAV